jgi:hypothetical protein
VVEPDAGVPEGIPQSVGQIVDLSAVPAVVQQDEVEVGPRPELPPGQAADCGQCYAGGRWTRLLVQLDQDGLDALGDRTPTIRPCGGVPPGPDRDVETLAG